MCEMPACCDCAQLLFPGDPRAGITWASDQLFPNEVPLDDALPWEFYALYLWKARLCLGINLTSLENLSALQGRGSESPQTQCSVTA